MFRIILAHPVAHLNTHPPHPLLEFIDYPNKTQRIGRAKHTIATHTINREENARSAFPDDAVI